MKLNTIEEGIQDIKEGKFLIVVDDEDRENEGDFVLAAEMITPEKVNFMATHGRGLICAPITEKRCKELNLNLMVPDNTALHQTPFTVSIDAKIEGCTTGISTYDRSKTIELLARDDALPSDFGAPGHIFPLMARDAGVIRRAGHTEAVIDLTRLAGLKPAGVLVEILNEDGTMARLPDLMKIAEKFDIKIISIQDLIAYRIKTETLIEKGVKAVMPTKYGDFNIIPFKQTTNGVEHFALVKGDWTEEDEVLVRVHSSCATGDIVGSLKCDCGEQLHEALRKIEKEGRGALIYLNQEGRGIGLMNKIKAYKLQEEGMDTVEANVHLGFKPDERDYGIGAQIMRSLNIKKLRLMTNNPTKKVGITGYGLEVMGTESIEVKPHKTNMFYMKTKKEKMDHNLTNFSYEEE